MGMTFEQKVQKYRIQMQQLLPQGKAWPRSADAKLTTLLNATAKEPARIEMRMEQLLKEADPRTASTLLPEWEEFAGLPDSCSQSIATTLQERRQAVVAKLTMRGGQSKPYFLHLAEKLGYQVAIKEYRPFTCGRSKCGDNLSGPAVNRFVWKCDVTGPRVTRFKCGASRCGEKLGKISRAEDLECKFNKLKPAQTKLIFGYTGV